MQLKERLKNGEVVKIGFRKAEKGEGGHSSGCGFIFCGTVNRKAKDYIKRKSEQEKKRLEKRLRFVTAALEAELHRRPFIPAEDEKEKRKNEKAIKRYEKEKPELTEKIKNWIPFMDREVVEEYMSLLNPENTVILCDGDEYGKFWTIKEFKEKYKWAEGEDEENVGKSENIL